MYKPKYSLRKIAYFVATADAGTVTKAAERLNISQSALTDGLSALELETGVQLLRRRKARGTQLTSNGEKTLKIARDLLRLSEELEAALDTIEHRIQGEINIGCYSTLLPLLAPKLIIKMEQAYPELKLNFIEGNQDSLQNKLLSGQLDAALMYEVGISQNLVCKPLMDLSPYILMAPQHRFAEQETVYLKDICADEMIMLDLSPSVINTESFFHEHDLEPTVRYRTSNPEFLRSLVARNLGYAILVHKTKIDKSHEGMPYLVKEIGEKLSSNHVSLIHDHHVELPKKLKALKEVSRALFVT